MLNGKHLISGRWIETSIAFTNDPVVGGPDTFCAGTVAVVDQAAEAAEAAFSSFGQSSVKERSEFLRAIAEELSARREDIVQTGARETGLPTPRLNGELDRTCGQLVLFARPCGRI
ncbi:MULTISPECIES: aldehyde dehydrogenase family protein [unclassified Labrenzia]|uniref:aldehyde dehydrogenase family protein n=1 Tax=unclassified Labrenzia TaxID=2648686 RepID=UPI0009DCCAC9|nr:MULTISPECIES: aldehyde dehydrogenase family protein [unclassified Labrenzia]